MPLKTFLKIMEKSLVKISQNWSCSKTLNLWCIIIWSTYVQRKQIFDNFMISLPDKTENPLWLISQLRAKAESVWNIVFNLNLVITGVIHEERSGVCDHEITQIMWNLPRQVFSIVVSTESLVLTRNYHLLRITFKLLLTVIPGL